MKGENEARRKSEEHEREGGGEDAAPIPPVYKEEEGITTLLYIDPVGPCFRKRKRKRWRRDKKPIAV